MTGSLTTFIVVLLSVSVAGCSSKVTGYDTKILFVGDSDYTAQTEFKHLTESGWEVKATRRAWTNLPYPYNGKEWGPGD
jgi:hypothetical protein